jgi:hypothetical protein
MFAILQDYEAPDEVVQIIAQHAYRQGAGTVSQGKLIRESAGIMGIIDIAPCRERKRNLAPVLCVLAIPNASTRG